MGHHSFASIVCHRLPIGRRFKTPNYWQRMTGSVTEDDGRALQFGCNEGGPAELCDRFHFFEQELTLEAWERMRERHKLAKRTRHNYYSWGTRKGEGRKFGGSWTSPSFHVGVIYRHNHFGER